MIGSGYGAGNLAGGGKTPETQTESGAPTTIPKKKQHVHRSSYMGPRNRRTERPALNFGSNINCNEAKIVLVNDYFYDALARLEEAFPATIFIRVDEIAKRLPEILKVKLAQS